MSEAASEAGGQAGHALKPEKVRKGDAKRERDRRAKKDKRRAGLRDSALFFERPQREIHDDQRE